MSSLPAWPYPFWIAHRGGGKLAPENTLAAFRTGAAHGYRMFECDVKLSADGAAFLMHDSDLERTTSGHGPSAALPWAELSRLDAGSWHSPAFAGEPLPLFADVADFCRREGCALNVEIKPSPGCEEETGRVVAREAARLWGGRHPPPLMSSFSYAALQAAQRAEPALPRALLLDAVPADWLEQAASLGCVAVVCEHSLWTPARVGQAHAAGLRALAYTENDRAEAQRLQALQIDGLITDRIDLFPPG